MTSRTAGRLAQAPPNYRQRERWTPRRTGPKAPARPGLQRFPAAQWCSGCATYERLLDGRTDGRTRSPARSQATTRTCGANSAMTGCHEAATSWRPAASTTSGRPAPASTRCSTRSPTSRAHAAAGAEKRQRPRTPRSGRHGRQCPPAVISVQNESLFAPAYEESSYSPWRQVVSEAAAGSIAGWRRYPPWSSRGRGAWPGPPGPRRSRWGWRMLG